MRSKLLRQISVRLPDDLLEKIKTRCEEGAISQSCLFRAALENQLGMQGDCPNVSDSGANAARRPRNE